MPMGAMRSMNSSLLSKSEGRPEGSWTEALLSSDGENRREGYGIELQQLTHVAYLECDFASYQLLTSKNSSEGRKHVPICDNYAYTLVLYSVILDSY